MTLEFSPLFIGAFVVAAIGLVLLVSGDTWSSLPFWLRNILAIIIFLAVVVMGFSLLQ